jgi:hypothetical protein
MIEGSCQHKGEAVQPARPGNNYGLPIFATSTGLEQNCLFNKGTDVFLSGIAPTVGTIINHTQQSGYSIPQTQNRPALAAGAIP